MISNHGKDWRGWNIGSAALASTNPIEELEPIPKPSILQKQWCRSKRLMSRLVIRIPVMNLNTKCSLRIIQS